MRPLAAYSCSYSYSYSYSFFYTLHPPVHQREELLGQEEEAEGAEDTERQRGADAGRDRHG